MREIKFRAWDIKSERMLPVNSPGGSITTDRITLSYNLELLHDGFEVMQCTGLKDRKGKDTFEGDIVRWSDYYKPGVIEWDEGSAGFVVKNEQMAIVNIENTEIIGNKFENPELLEGN